MNVSHPNNFVFWGIPHTGSELIFAAFARHYGLEGPKLDDGTRPMSYELGIPPGAQTYLTIALRRNPFSRLVSFWNEFREQKADPKVDPSWRLEIQAFIEEHPKDFAAFVRFVFEESDLTEVALPSQMSFYQDGRYPGYWIRYENLDLDFGRLAFVNSVVKFLRSNSDYWKKLYTPKLQKIVVAHWGLDFTQLGYVMEIN